MAGCAARVQRIDVVIVAALVLAAALSAIGVATYEDDRMASFTITWNVRDEALEVPAVSHTGAGEAEATFDVARANLTVVEVVVGIEGAAARVQPTLVRVELVSPRNNTTAAEGELPLGPGATIEIPIEMPLAELPDAPTMTGPSLEAARRALNATVSSSLGVGTWTLRASFAPGAPGPLGDEAHTLTAAVTLRYYEAELAVVGPEVGR